MRRQKGTRASEVNSNDNEDAITTVDVVTDKRPTCNSSPCFLLLSELVSSDLLPKRRENSSIISSKMLQEKKNSSSPSWRSSNLDRCRKYWSVSAPLSDARTLIGNPPLPNPLSSSRLNLEKEIPWWSKKCNLAKRLNFVVRRLTVGPTGLGKPARESNPESSDSFLRF